MILNIFLPYFLHQPSEIRGFSSLLKNVKSPRYHRAEVVAHDIIRYSLTSYRGWNKREWDLLTFRGTVRIVRADCVPWYRDFFHLFTKSRGRREREREKDDCVISSRTIISIAIIAFFPFFLFQGGGSCLSSARLNRNGRKKETEECTEWKRRFDRFIVFGSLMRFHERSDGIRLFPVKKLFKRFLE